MTIATLRRKWAKRIAPEDFFILLAHATGKEKIFLLTHPDATLSEEAEARATDSLERRLYHEPVAYIVGQKEFYGRAFLVTKDALIPRPETELLVEQVLAYYTLHSGAKNKIDFIDIGTGSGAIIITLAQEIPPLLPSTTDVHFFALDISLPALRIAGENAKRHESVEHILFLAGDLLDTFSPPREKNRHAIIAANLPYLSTTIYNESAPDVRLHEPKSALVSGTDGLAHYRRLFLQLKTLAPHYLSTTVFLEFSPEQSVPLSREIQTFWPQAKPQIFPDLSGKDRLLQVTLP